VRFLLRYDEIGELLVAILEEIGGLKQAILTETNDDVEQLLKKEAPESKQEQTEAQDTKENEPKLRANTHIWLQFGSIPLGTACNLWDVIHNSRLKTGGKVQSP